MTRFLLFAGTLACCCSVCAQTCEGGVYLNPQVIRGEGTPQVASAANNLSEFLSKTGLSAVPVLNVSNVDETLAALKRARPPCWVFGNPVVGLASGYRPVAINTEEIQPAVLVLADVGPDKDPKAVELSKLPAPEQQKALASLKQATCFGIKSGVTTAMVKAEKLCGSVVDVAPQQGLGQSYLPTKAGFEWRAGKWVGWITRAQSARTASMANQIGSDPQLHQARLLSIPTQGSSWGYGIYVRADIPADIVTKVAAQFSSLKQPDASLSRALDVGATFKFAAPASAEIEAMRKSLDLAP